MCVQPGAGHASSAARSAEGVQSKRARAPDRGFVYAWVALCARTSLAFRVSTAKKILRLLFRLAVIGLVVWGVQRTLRDALNDLGRQGWSPADMHYGWLAAACMLYVLGLLPAGIYWHRVLQALDVHTGLMRALRAYFIGHLGKYVPGKAMVVVLRAGIVSVKAGSRQPKAGGLSAMVEAPGELERVARTAITGVADQSDVPASSASSASVGKPGQAEEPQAADESTAGAAAAGVVGPDTAAAGVVRADTPVAGIVGREIPAAGVVGPDTAAAVPELQPQGRATEHLVQGSGLTSSAVMARAAAAVFYETFGMMAAGCTVALCCLLLLRPMRCDLVGMAAAGALLLGLPTVPAVLRRVVPRLSALGVRAEAVAWVASVPVRVAASGWVSMAGGWLLLGLSLWAVVLGVAGSVSISWHEGWLASTATAALAMCAGFLSLLPAGLVVREAVVLVLLSPLVGERAALLAGVLSRVVSVVAELGISVILYPYAVDRDPRLQRSRESRDPVE